jgi:hypothetical protein
MKQFFALVLACTLAAGGATAMTYHSNVNFDELRRLFRRDLVARLRGALAGTCSRKSERQHVLGPVFATIVLLVGHRYK